ncbi:MAG: hypothetical protein K8S22_17965 [Betaproteobacteria bacterium]|nr:hypothetical protein [Betaproteobacteria bacterium]
MSNETVHRDHLTRRTRNKTRRTALARKGEEIRRKVHGNAHVDAVYRDAEPFMAMFQDMPARRVDPKRNR